MEHLPEDVIAKAIEPFGFKKRRKNHWYRDYSDVLQIIALQKSRWGAPILFEFGDLAERTGAGRKTALLQVTYSMPPPEAFKVMIGADHLRLIAKRKGLGLL
jgi:Domain of unknown function (DUF4304)